jgi:hypothetical protein
MNHSPDLLPKGVHRKLFKDMPTVDFGPTGRFPEGKLCSNDRGEIIFGVAHDPVTAKVIVEFGTPVTWLGLNAAQAMELANSLLKHARDVRTIRNDNRTDVKADEHK